MSFIRMKSVLACGMAAALLGAPSQASAFCCLFNLFHHCHRPPAAPVATFAPAPAPVCPAPVQTQVSYVPQTCYRTVYTCQPVTTMRPVTTTDPCTGCPVTCLRPTTSYVQKPTVVPYTTYRPVYTQVAAPVATNPCAAPAQTYYAPAAPSTGCCGTTPSVSAPITTTPSTITPSLTPTPTPSLSPSTPVPSLSPTPSTSFSIPSTSSSPSAIPSYNAPSATTSPSMGPSITPQTLQPSNSSNTFAPNSSLRPIPDLHRQTEADPSNADSNAPRLLDPRDRTTARPLPRSFYIVPAVAKQEQILPHASQTSSADSKTDADGWHAAR